MAQIIESIDVNVPVSHAYNQWTQFESFSQLLDEVESHAGVVTFHKLSDDTSRVTVQIDREPEGLLEKVGSFVGAGSRAVKNDLDNFKEFIEAQGTPTGSWRGDVDA